MSNVNVQQALAEMRTLAARAKAGPQAAEPTGKNEGAEFQGLLRNALETVNGLQQDSSQKTDAFLKGDDVSLTQVMVAGQKSRVAFEAVKQTRSHLLEAYREISRMQV